MPPKRRPASAASESEETPSPAAAIPVPESAKAPSPAPAKTPSPASEIPAPRSVPPITFEDDSDDSDSEEEFFTPRAFVRANPARAETALRKALDEKGKNTEGPYVSTTEVSFDERTRKTLQKMKAVKLKKRANELFDQGKYSDAAETYEEAYTLDPSDKRLLELKEKSLSSLKFKSELRKSFSKYDDKQKKRKERKKGGSDRKTKKKSKKKLKKKKSKRKSKYIRSKRSKKFYLK